MGGSPMVRAGAWFCLSRTLDFNTWFWRMVVASSICAVASFSLTVGSLMGVVERLQIRLCAIAAKVPPELSPWGQVPL